jgi:hypothetical protein
MAVFDWTHQLRKYKSKENVQAPKVNSLTGRYVAVSPSIHDELNYRYSQYSKSYWAGVKERQNAYLLKTYASQKEESVPEDTASPVPLKARRKYHF